MWIGIGKLLLIAVSFQTIQLDSQFDKIADRLTTTAAKMDATFVASIEEEDRSLQNSSAVRGNLAWQLSDDGEIAGDLLVTISKEKLDEIKKNIALENCVKWSNADDLDAPSEFSPIIHNKNYGACVDFSSETNLWEISLLHENPKSMVGAHPLSGLTKMMPYQWSLKRLSEHPDAELVSIETMKANPDLVQCKFDLSLTPASAPFKQAFRGSWTMTYDKIKNCIIRQELRDSGNSEGIVYQYDFEEGSDLPNALKQVDSFVWQDGKKHTIENRYKFLLISSKHAMPSSGCTLSFFGLPEPSANSPREVANSGRWWFLVLGALVAGAIVLRISRRESK